MERSPLFGLQAVPIGPSVEIWSVLILVLVLFLVDFGGSLADGCSDDVKMLIFLLFCLADDVLGRRSGEALLWLG